MNRFAFHMHGAKYAPLYDIRGLGPDCTALVTALAIGQRVTVCGACARLLTAQNATRVYVKRVRAD